MEKCKVCNAVITDCLCDKCGHDASMDFEDLPTLGKLPQWVPSVARKKQTWNNEQADADVCGTCGGMTFRFLGEKGVLRCTRCLAERKLQLEQNVKTIINGVKPNVTSDDIPKSEVKKDTHVLTQGATIWKKAGDMSGSQPIWLDTTPEKDTQGKQTLTGKKYHASGKIKRIATGNGHTVGLRADGSVRAKGFYSGKSELESWTGVAAIAASGRSTYAVFPNGTVRTTDPKVRDSVRLWKNITAVAAGGVHAVGLTNEGKVVSVGNNAYGQCDLWGWKDIRSVAVGGFHTVGLHRDGWVMATGSNDSGQCNTVWYEITAVAAGYSHSVGLRKNGTVVAVGNNNYGQCETKHWTDIVAISACNHHTVGLKKDGTVVATGNNTYGQCNTASWKGIVAIAAGDWHTVGLKKDGTVVAVGNNGDGQCLVANWDL